MYSVPQPTNVPSRDSARPQYEVPAARSPAMLSPGIREVLHMLDALEKEATAQN